MIDPIMLRKGAVLVTDYGSKMLADKCLKQLNIYLGNVSDFNIDFHILRTTDGTDKLIRVIFLIVIHLVQVACHKSSTGGA